jgi:hypothetical protein
MLCGEAMNEAMKQAWVEITQMMGEPTPEELHVFLRTWQKAIQAEREECAKLCEGLLERPSGYQGTWEGYGKFKTQMTGQECAAAIRARGQA